MLSRGIITTLLITIVSCVLTAQQAESPQLYVIQLAVYDNSSDYKKNERKLKLLEKYGRVYPRNKSNGIVKAYLDDYGQPFEEDKARSTLKAVKRNRFFRKAFLVDQSTIGGGFAAPDIDISDEEMIISIRLKGGGEVDLYEGPTAAPTPAATTPTVSVAAEPAPAPEVYGIQLGCFSKERSLEDLINQYQFTAAEQRNLANLVYSYPIALSNGKSCTKYAFGRYSSQAEAATRLAQLSQIAGESLYLVRLQRNKRGTLVFNKVQQ